MSKLLEVMAYCGKDVDHYCDVVSLGEDIYSNITHCPVCGAKLIRQSAFVES